MNYSLKKVVGYIAQERTLAEKCPNMLWYVISHEYRNVSGFIDLAPSLKLDFMATFFSYFYHFDQPLRS